MGRVVRRLAWVLALVPALASAGAPTSEPTMSPPTAPTGHAFVIEIAGEIDLGLAPYVERVLKGANAEAMVDASVEIPGLDSKTSTLTLTTSEALKYQVAAFEASSVEEVCQKLGRPAPSILRPGLNWAERIARFLSDSAISSLLMSLG